MSVPPDDDPLGRSVFRHLPEGRRALLRTRFRPERFAFGDVIVRQGEEADAYYVLTSGRARVVKESENGTELSLTVLRRGDGFGEAALTTGGRRSATVRCSAAVEALRLARTDFLALLQESPELEGALEVTARMKRLHGFLYEFSDFGRLPPACLQSLIEGLEPVRFLKGETILAEGDSTGPLYVVEEGRVRVFRASDGRARDLAFKRAGDYFGELSALSGARRTATAQAASDCRLLALRPEAVTRLRDEFPEFEALLQERIAQYRVDTTARVPLDFATEMLPADASVANKVALEPAAPEAGRPSARRGRAGGDAPEDGEPVPDDAAATGSSRRTRGRRRRFPFTAQIDEMDCAAACLDMLGRHFGRDAGLPRVRALCHTSSDGASLQGICEAAGELGMAARAAKVSASRLDDVPLPAIVHYEGDHWVVLYDVDEGHVRVSDPARGRRRLDRAAFTARWTGYAALFDHTTEVAGGRRRRSSFAWLVPFFARHRAVLIQVLLLAMVVSALQLLLPVLTQTVIDTVIVDRDVGLLSLIMAAIGAAVVLLVGAGFCQQYLLAFAAVRIDAAILDFLTRRLLALPMRYFHARRTGDIQRRLDGAQEVREFVVQHGIGGVLSAVQLFGTFVLMWLYSARLALVFAATVPIYAAMVFLSVRYLKPILMDLEESRGRYRSHQIDAIKGIEAVKAASAETSFRDAMLAQFMSVSKPMFRGTLFLMAYDGAIQTLAVISTAIFLWLGAGLVLQGRLSVGGFVAFNTLAMMAHADVLRLLSIGERVLTSSVLLDRLDDIFQQEPEQGADRTRLRPVPSLEGHIQLRNVGFRFGGPGSPPILEGVTLDIPAGASVALVGRSGCGKTTLIKLVAGLLEPTEGTILFDRMDLATINHRALRRNIGLVLQESHVFDGTVRDNIAFGDLAPDPERVVRAAQMASAHAFIMRLPLRYDTRIGESGLLLSGGQKQRVVIARALYADPPVMIFDEATSALDSESERAIQANMTRLLSGRTSIVVAHRLSTIRDADKIVVLERGRIVETGTHDELMAARGLYFYLSSRQAVV